MATPMPQLPPGMPPGAIPPGMAPPGMQGPPAQIPINPALQSLLDSLPHTETPFTLIDVPVPNTQPPQNNTIAVCPTHKQMMCEACGVNFSDLNYMHQFLRSAPPEAIPPPPNVPAPPQRAEMIKNAKEQGNAAFKSQNFPLAIQHYSRSADMALSRPPWEFHAVSRDETAIALCNRSAAFAFAGAWVNALTDAEAVIALKRPWTKGHFRRARALVGLNRHEEARDAIVDGLQFEPNDKELNSFLKEIDEKLVELDA